MEAPTKNNVNPRLLFFLFFYDRSTFAPFKSRDCSPAAINNFISGQEGSDHNGGQDGLRFPQQHCTTRGHGA